MRERLRKDGNFCCFRVYKNVQENRWKKRKRMTGKGRGGGIRVWRCIEDEKKEEGREQEGQTLGEVKV